MPKILLMEDNELNRGLLARYRKRRVFEGVLALDGQEAWTQARAEWPDLILMDLDLPVLEGGEATRLLEAAPEARAIPSSP
jgi:CheY-like chemotaxis protein